jgi:hypothetical protein
MILIYQLTFFHKHITLNYYQYKMQILYFEYLFLSYNRIEFSNNIKSNI